MEIFNTTIEIKNPGPHLHGLRFASLIFTIIVARKIAPENYGLFGLAALIITYITYFNLGSQYSINKELSIDITNNEKTVVLIRA